MADTERSGALELDSNFITFENRDIGRKGIIRLIGGISGVQIKLSKWWSPIFGNDIFCKFTYNEKAFEIEDLRGESWWFSITEQNLLESQNELQRFRKKLATISSPSALRSFHSLRGTRFQRAPCKGVIRTKLE